VTVEARELFHLEKVSVSFGVIEALSAVSMSVRAGERVALVGPSGGGKSTLLRAMIGSGPTPSAGQVQTLGVDLQQVSETERQAVRQKIGFIAQEGGLVPTLRVVQNVALGPIGSQSFWTSWRKVFFPRRSEAAQILEVLRQVGIEEKLYWRTDRLSGGQQQRVAIARALWQQPKALLADEPISSLDPARGRAVMSLLTRLAQERQLTLVVSLHQFDLAQAYCDRLIGLRHGKVIFDRAAAEVGQAEYHQLYDLSAEELAES
jgi:phosphonate transport system ATP-binding protein